MLDYSLFYKRYGTRKLADIISPITLDSKEFEFPKNTMLYWFKVSDIPVHITREYGYLKKNSSMYVMPRVEYGDETVGSFRRKRVPEMEIVKEAADHEKNFKYVKPSKSKLQVTSKDIFIMSYGYLNSVYSYNPNPLNEYFKWYNNFSTVIEEVKSTKNKNDRTKFILVDLPSRVPNRNRLDRYAENITTGDIKKLPDPKIFTIVDIWRFLTPEFKKKSILNKLTNKELKNTTLMFVAGTRVVFLNMYILASIVEEYELETKLKQQKASTARKLFYIFINKILSSVPEEQEVANKEDAKKIRQGITEDDGQLEEEENDDPTKNVDEIIEKEIPEQPDLDEENIDEDVSAYELREIAESSHMQEFQNLEDLYNLDESSYDKIQDEIDSLDKYGLITKKQKENIESILNKQRSKGPDGVKSPYEDIDEPLSDVLDDTDDDIEISEEETSINDTPSVIDKRMNKDVTSVLNKKYIKQQYKKDMVRSIYGIQNGSIVIEDYDIAVKESILGGVEEHTLTVRSLNGRPTKIRMNLPKINEDGTFKLSSNNYYLRKQRSDAPIRKISFNRVSLSSYYGKLFVSKAAVKREDFGYWFKNQLVKLYEEDDKLKDVIFVNVDNVDTKLPSDYTKLSRYIKSFKYGNKLYHFEYDTRESILKDGMKLSDIENDGTTLIGMEGKVPLVINDNNQVFKYTDKEYVETDTVFDTVGISKDKGPTEYATIKVYKETLPVVILLSYYLGLKEVMKLLKTRFKEFESSKRVKPENDEYIIKFKDVKFLIKKDYGLSDMILSGLNKYKKIIPSIPFKSFNSKDKFEAVFSHLELPILYVNEIKMLEDLFVDPITKTLLKSMKEPVTFIGLLFRSGELLLDDNYKNPNNINDVTIKGHERIAGMVYKELISSLKEYENKSHFSKAKLNVNPYNIINKINEDSTTVLVDDINPIAELKQKEDVTYLGEGGRSKDSMSRDTRIMHESEIGVISEATKDSGQVGVSAYMSAAPSIKNTKGQVGEFSFKEDGWPAVLSTSAMLAPFATKDDVKRLNFASIQNSHVIPMKDMRAPYVRTGYESVLAVRADDKFVTSAIEDGEVLSVSKNNIEVKYKESGREKYKIKDWTSKEESESCYIHVMVPNLKKGDKFKKDDTLIYDSSFFEPDVFDPKRVVYKSGSMVNVAMLEDPETYEDSTAIQRKLYEKLGTTVSKVKSNIVTNTDNVHDLVNVGDKVEPNDKLFTVTDASLGDNNEYDERALEILKELQSSAPNAKVKGKVRKVIIYYNCEFEDLSKTLKKYVKITDEMLIKDEGFTGQVDSSYSINGKPLLEDQVEIKVYIDAFEGMGIGDKAIIANQLKCTQGDVFDYEINGNKDSKEVEAVFSTRSNRARIVSSPDLIGTTSTLLEKIKDDVVDEYFS